MRANTQASRPMLASAILSGLLLLLAIVVILLVLIFTGFARAEDAAIIVTPPSFMAEFSDLIVLGVGAAVMILFAFVGPPLVRLIGQENTNRLQAAFQAAAERAAGMAYLRMSGATAPTAEAKLYALNEGVGYLKRTMPDTIKKLGAGEETLRQAVEANLGKLAAKK